MSGEFFVDGFFKEGPKGLEELKAGIADGNTGWLERLCYYSQRVTGSAGYWRAKRAEVYSWINYHVEAGHGPPLFFIGPLCPPPPSLPGGSTKRGPPSLHMRRLVN